MNKEEIIAEVIVDLYEIRASVLPPASATAQQGMQELFKYNFLNVIIANLSDKYKVKDGDIRDAIRRRGAAKNNRNGLDHPCMNCPEPGCRHDHCVECIKRRQFI